MSITWSPPVETSPAEERILSRSKKAELGAGASGPLFCEFEGQGLTVAEMHIDRGLLGAADVELRRHDAMARAEEPRS